MYLDGFIYPESDNQVYPVLQRKGFTLAQQKAIAEEWYWIAFERETAVRDYLEGYGNLQDGCWWRPPPVPPSQLRHSVIAAPPSSSSGTSQSSPGPGPRT